MDNIDTAQITSGNIRLTGDTISNIVGDDINMNDIATTQITAGNI